MRIKYCGFTLVELLIVIIIIGILATIAMPAYQGIIWKARNAEVCNIVGQLAQAERIYYAQWNGYTLPSPDGDDNQNCVGNNIPAGSTYIQKILGVDIPPSCYFVYIVTPCPSTWAFTGIYYRQPDYNWSWFYNYGTNTWYDYAPGGDPSLTGLSHKYFTPPK